MRTLVVDDSKAMRTMVVNYLQEMGITDIVQAVDGAEATLLLSVDPEIKLILCDWNMPVMDGGTLLKNIRKERGKDSLTFVMITTASKKENVIEAIKNGANNYLIKPFTKDTFQEKIQEVLL